MSVSSKRRYDTSPQTPRLHKMTPAEVGWLAGFLEGEGSFVILSPQKKNPYGNFIVCVKSTDQDVIKTAQRITGVGRIKFVEQSKGNPGRWKDVWGWTVAKRAHVRLVIKTVLPYLHARRRARALEVLTALERHEAYMRGAQLPLDLDT